MKHFLRNIDNNKQPGRVPWLCAGIVLAVIRDAGKPMTPQSVHTALMLDDATVKHGTVRQAMARMAQTGKLHLADYGEYELPTR